MRTKVTPGLFVSWIREVDCENEYVSPKGPDAWTGRLAMEMNNVATVAKKVIF